MTKDLVFRQKLQEAGVTKGMLTLYQQYLDSGNKQGQERMLRQFRRIQSAKLRSDKEKLACLDYLIAKVEKTENCLKESKGADMKGVFLR